MTEQNTSINGSTGVNNDEESIDVRNELFREKMFADPLFIWIISVIEIPIMILSLFTLCALIKSRRASSVFVGQLILSDLIQIICMLMITIIELPDDLEEVLDLIEQWRDAYYYSLIVGLYFMACVAFERYLLVSHPIWYKSHNSLKVSCVISVIIWFVPLIFADIDSDSLSFERVKRSIGCFIPYPIIILCFVGTRRGLSHAISLTSLKRKLILGSLFLVLLTYTFLILPFVILSFIRETFPIKHSSLGLLVKVIRYVKFLLFLNPLADCLLYLFMRPDAGDLINFDHCCCRIDTHQNSRHSRDEHTMERRL
ncbi:ovarian cancer G-protein coupled receptor 1-like [Ctenopharyngodon idella]|uniref:ovarian cancer G-protein coupled receptor 1-like n=1 Tax=Ctenopharyngodon idella TaxID=7959 RepID=UPI00223279ED|nr:ovarian cancer G-protein coupled receptor 1-like [Ctenopharyngodon idella]XP_051736268.1 ovarian cancer G-protein coupled receptor 1-like [Ctenopharyngodon idella]XP_051736277.1 ovarian cancer G-protein coupled receptor 1-like [Ctenopharyngodon idella]